MEILSIIADIVLVIVYIIGIILIMKENKNE